MEDRLRILSRRCERILTEQDLLRKMQLSRPLRIKMGMDPTAPDVTLGHAVPLKVIRQFQEWGHKAVLIIGDVTGRVGDPSGVNVTRPMLTAEQVQTNATTYIQQVGRILLSDPQHLEIRYNSEWLAKMDVFELIRLAGRKTVAQMLQRDSFKERFEKGSDIHLHEFIYPLLQGWDSVAIEADVEMGGSDQLFNNLVGREFQAEMGKDPQVVMVTPLLVGTDGVMKMSKSKGNYVAVTDEPNNMFGKIMSIPDSLLENYYTLLTDLPAEEFKPLIASDPRNAKVRLAQTIVAWLHGEPAGHGAVEHFNRTIVNKEIPAEMPEIQVGAGPHQLAPLLVKAGLAASNSEAIRKIREGAVRIDGQKVMDFQKQYSFDAPAVLQLGNRKFARLIP
ncbi:MAG TPA: tyrosine--tRNA ligase [Tepidisphaeraceae bacterium]|nr:tyrosine--tRNA ligase [Tepidisphaeraceae bacterium]